MIWAVVQFVVGYMMLVGGMQFHINYVVNARNLIGYSLFEVLLSGTSEELFYRGLIVTVTLKIMSVYIKKQRNLYILTVLVSIIIFMAGHISFDLFPFKITYIDPLQQLTVIIVSVFYCISFLKTKSLLGPILMHNLINGVATATRLLFSSSNLF
jgi:membrane protease YdiL (CAAX protease family)